MFFRVSRTTRTIAIAFAILAFGAVAETADAQDADGAGSTFVAPMIAKWAADYVKISGVKIAYDSVGSGAGIQKIEAGEVDFGATDKPLDPAELAKYGLCQFPVLIGGVVPVVNLSGIAPGQIKFSGQLLADIFLHKVTRWDAPEIRALNPGLILPAMPITVVHRSDGSGTTYNWTDFLAKSSAAWKAEFGAALSLNWPTGIGGNGNIGVAEAVFHTQGAIGYVEYAYALKNKLNIALVANRFGMFVPPTPETFQASAESVDWKRHQDFSVLMTNAGGPIAYPVTATTFILMYKAPKDLSRATAALKFFKWALEYGDQQANDLQYVALPPAVVLLIESYWKSHIKIQSLRASVR